MRTRFFTDLVAAADAHPELVLVTADIGFGAVDDFVARYPDRFVNAGVAEQNMTGLAAGIALGGGRVFTYSIANFPTLRCLEQIRNDVAYHHADVTVVAVGGGLAYGALGMSHHATEDLAVMRSVPGVAVAAPGDPEETGAVLADLVANGGPAYLRLGKAGERSVHPLPLRLARGESVPLRTGGDLAIFSTGAILENALRAADLLARSGVRADVRSFPWLDPIDTLAVHDAARRYDTIVTVEEHSITGGLGSAVAEILAELPRSAALIRVALPARFSSLVGDQDYLRRAAGLDPEGISARVLEQLEVNRGLACQVR
ncbi:transketolase family protein [Paractinoplanes rishiriensis]|uniref:1-deoxy-D-xylulose-5-phosphate synthase n=1 Tax=Paractinoplanes rishiriensis TaxID=1050105 RepID=A0A919JYZ2_9ACTN|nr:transketolase C-terminal domain-containing protein [Actinoplanes rishiriensis]GIE97303.1 1-deoxy-D-xylulose-5-phosphate synthase [Actinoplanes rishiriensis]